MSHDTRAPTIMPLAIPTGSSSGHALAVSTNPSSVDNMPELPIVAEKEIKKTSASRVLLRLLKRKNTDGSAEIELSSKVTNNDASSDGTTVLAITPLVAAEDLTVESGTSTKQTNPPKKFKMGKTVVTASNTPNKPKKGHTGSKKK
ncbi:uncharacterized protein [Triticum aestivum]|uniref:uncharacterized protein n=1 Tax=Triticum aestivum TaxID=4565 RepID=UPI001D0096FA|nr:uncharacterized protein LOC123103931 [Triticum aestivum]